MTKSIPTRFVLILLISSSVFLSFTPSNWHDHLLSPEDRQLEQRDTERGPELSSAIGEEPRWESFNKWLCFSTQFATAECTDLDGGKSQTPTLRIAVNGALYDYERQQPIQLYEFDLEEEPEVGCYDVVEKWKTLLGGEDSVCVYAAYLQDLPLEHFSAERVQEWTLWVISQIKTSKGYWKAHEEESEEDEAFNQTDESDNAQEIED